MGLSSTGLGGRQLGSRRLSKLLELDSFHLRKMVHRMAIPPSEAAMPMMMVIVVLLALLLSETLP